VTDDPDVMTVEEGAAFLRVGRNQLYDAIGRGEVPHRRIGRTIRLSKTAARLRSALRSTP
jgi:excisionase family DNA binding protein